MSTSSSRLFAAAMVLSAVTACATTHTANTVKAPVAARRTRIDPTTPIATSSWNWDGKGFSGAIAWESCRFETTWKETEQRITTRKPNRTLPYLFLIAGGALTVAGTATYDFGSGELRCDDYGGCRIEEPDNTSSHLLWIAGAVMAGTGLIWKAQRPSTTVEDVASEQKSSHRTGPCLEAEDISELKIVLQIAERKFLRVRVNRDWTARIEIPEGVDVPRNVDLPVVVYRVPPDAAAVVSRWEVVGRARIDSE